MRKILTITTCYLMIIHLGFASNIEVKTFNLLIEPINIEAINESNLRTDLTEGTTIIFIKELTLSTSTLTFSSLPESPKLFDITSNVSWEIESNQSWLTLSKTIGLNNATIAVTASANPTISTRTGIITVMGTGVNNRTITVTQNGMTTNIEELTRENSFVIYPSPNNGNFTLKMNSFSGKIVNIKIVNMLGVTVDEHIVENIPTIYKKEIDISRMASGVYFVSVQTSTTKIVKSFLVQK